MDPIIGSEAIAGGSLTRGQLRWNYWAVHPDVYLLKGAPLDLDTRTRAAWLWTRRRGVVAGRAAAACYCQPIEPHAPVELIAESRGRRPGVITRNERIGGDEITRYRGMSVTTPDRTAWDLARFLPTSQAVPHLDALAAATHFSREEVFEIARRYRGARGNELGRRNLWEMDGGAASPEESRIRMILVDGGIPRPETDLRVGSGPLAIRIAMGWPYFRVGLRYRAQPVPPEHEVTEQLVGQELALAGWLMVTVVPQHFDRQIVTAVRCALRYRAGIRP